MGVKDLMKVLRAQCPEVLHSCAPRAVEGDVWIDTPLIVMAAVKKAEADGHDTLAAVDASLRRTSNMVRCLGPGKVHWVFDGKTRVQKVQTVVKRHEASTKFSEACARKAIDREVDTACSAMTVDDDDLSLAEHIVHSHAEAHSAPKSSLSTVFACAKGLAATLGDEVHTAKHDSEEFIARSMSAGDVAVSSDSDALPFGCSFVVQHFGSSTETWIVLSEVLQSLDMTLHQFQQFCVLLGTDFNSRMFGCGPAKALKCIRSDTFSLESFAAKESADAEWLSRAQGALRVFQSTKEESGVGCL